MTNKDYTSLACLGLICIAICMVAISILITEGLVWLACMGLDWEFNWLLGIGVWALMVLVGLALK